MKRILTPLIALVLALTTGLVPAAARTPAGPSTLSVAPVVVDAHLGYQKQRTCSPTAKPGTKALMSLLIRTWGGSSWGISRTCGIGGTSEHKEGRALDWHKDVRKAKDRKAVADVIKWLTSNRGEVAYRLGIMYIIWDQKIWSIYYQELGWRKMENRGSRTANHKDHVHISLSWDGAMKQTSWWTGVPITEPLNSKCGVNGARACLPTIKRSADVWTTTNVTVPPFLPAPWTVPGIGGSAQVGRILTAVAGNWVPAGSSISYQWLADGQPIAGATGEQYVVPATLLDKAMKVRVTALSPTGTAFTKTSDGTNDVVKANFASAPTPVIRGPRLTGGLLSIEMEAWRPLPTAWSYQWYRNGRRIAGATASTYRLVVGDLDKRISVKVTGKLAGYNYKSRTSKLTGKVVRGPLPVIQLPQVTGSAVVGETLTAQRGIWSPAPTSVRYQWYSDEVAIPNATASTYRLTAADEGTVVRVRVRGGRTGYLNAYAWSEPGPPVTGTVVPPTLGESGTDSESASPTPTPTPSPSPTPSATATGSGTPGSSPSAPDTASTED